MSKTFAKTKENAVKLLAAAEVLDLPVTAVEATSEGFVVSDELAEMAFSEEPKKTTRTAKAKSAATKKESE